MFVLLQVYPPEATAEDGSDGCCCLDVIAVDPLPNFVFQIHETAMAADAARWQQYFRDAPPQPRDEQVGEWPHAQLVRMDNRFRARLLRAFKRGKESREAAVATYDSISRN